ncbi:MAG: hypothetical protein B0W54_01285 [Cellvibrio sp. 79]|nr:MAG: hypothetical protein B0W54_01285 [Cellvibrio sp. 79]
MQYWRGALKWGFGILAVFLMACFIYGLFNRFSFIHASSPPGIDSGLAYAWVLGFLVGPFVLLAGALVGIVVVWRCKPRMQPGNCHQDKT